MLYKVQKVGESPTLIARRFGLPMSSLIAANPRKPTTLVAGQRTWRDLHIGETLNVPAGAGMVGDAASDAAIAALSAAGGPCLQQNIPLVCAAQAALGVTVDGKWGSGSSGASGGRIPACSPTPAFWGAKGSNLCTGGGGGGGSVAPPTASVTVTAMAAAAALAADSNYCNSVKSPGTAVNSAVHNFKAAWNAQNPGNPVPINTGNYEPSVAVALSSALGGAPVAPGCGGGSAPVVSPPSAPSIPSIPSVTPSSVPAAVQSLLSSNPCSQSSAPLVCAVQAALGLTVDGKYGPGTAGAVQRFVPSAPPGCSPAPLWWGAKGTSQCGGGVPSIPSIPSAPIPSVPSLPTVPGMPPVGPSQPIIVPPSSTTTSTTTTGGVSTGAIVVGALGITALLGIAAVAVSGKKGGSHGGGRRKSKGRRKSAHRKSTHRKKKRR